MCVCGNIHVITEKCECKVRASRAQNKKRREMMKEKKKLEQELIEREYNL